MPRPDNRPTDRQLKECGILMRKVRRSMRADWEFERFLDYLAKRPAHLIEAGRKELDSMEDLLGE